MRTFAYVMYVGTASTMEVEYDPSKILLGNRRSDYELRTLAAEVLKSWLDKTSEELELSEEDNYDNNPETWDLRFIITNESDMAWAIFTPYRGEPVMFVFNLI